MPNVQSLPAETIHRLLELGSLLPSDLSDFPGASYAFLRRSSLVCRAWRPAAQALLSRRVHLRQPRAIEAFVNRRGKLGITRELVLSSLSYGEKAEDPATALVAVVDRCEGLRSVILCGAATTLPLLCSPAMAGTSPSHTLTPITHSWFVRIAGVTSLDIIGDIDLSTPSDSSPEDVPFHLSHLALDALPSPPLFAALLRPSLKSLELFVGPYKLLPAHITGLTNVAPYLTTLNIFSTLLEPSLRPFFAGCTSLVHVTLNPVVAALAVSLIPNFLRELTIDRGYSSPSSFQATREIMQSNTVAVSKLKLLRFETSQSYSTLRAGGARELLEEWARRGIEVVCEHVDMMESGDGTGASPLGSRLAFRGR